MISGIEKNKDIPFVQHVMEKIHVIDEYIKIYGADIIEKYYQEHGTYNGIEDWINSIKNQSDENNR